MSTMVGYWVSKAGAPTSDWEDGLAYNPATGWFAIADGASTGLNSREWAYTLTRSFVSDRPAQVFGPRGHHAFVTWTDHARALFRRESEEFPVSRVPDWVRAEGDRVGAHATFLGGRIAADGLRVVAVGDCCLFRIRADAALESFPIADAGAFGTRPDLVPSMSTGGDERLQASVRDCRANLRPGDVVLAASDALAEWIVRNGARPEVQRGLAQISNGGFQRLCADLRSARELKNDDTTLWRATITADTSEAR